MTGASAHYSALKINTVEHDSSFGHDLSAKSKEREIAWEPGDEH